MTRTMDQILDSPMFVHDNEFEITCVWAELQKAREALRRYESREPHCDEEGSALLKTWGARIEAGGGHSEAIRNTTV